MLDAKAVNKIKAMYATMRWPQLWAAIDADPQLKPVFDTMRNAGWDLTRIVTNLRTLGHTPAEIEASKYLVSLNQQLAPLAPKIPVPGKEMQLSAPATAPPGPVAAKEAPSIAPQIPAAVRQAPTASNLTPSGTVQTPVSTTAPGQAPVVYQKPQEIAPSVRAQTGVALTPDANNFKIPAGTQTPEQNVDVNQGLNKLFPDVAQRHLQELQLARLPAGARLSEWQGAERDLQGEIDQGKTALTSSRPRAHAGLGVQSYLEATRRQAPFDVRAKILADYESGKIRPF